MNIVADYGDLCGECPLWVAAESALYWTDCGGLKFFGYAWTTRRSALLRENLEINGFRLNSNGGLVITNNSGVWLLADASATPRALATEVAGQPCRMNDCVADKHGRLLACSWFYGPAASYKLGRLLSFDNDGTPTVLDEGFHLANGLAFSPDDCKLYVTDSAQRTIFEYEYSLVKGSIGKRKELVRVPDSEGLPDGLRVDEQGCLWSAQWYGSQVVRYDPDGVVERRITVPAKQVSSLTFGGPNLTTLFITTAKQSEPMPFMPPSYDPNVGPFGGPLFSVELDIRGLPDLPADITKD
jgi:D-xylonolactonase